MSDDASAVSLGRAIMAARSARGLKRRELADRAGISYPYLSEIENGIKSGSTKYIEKIAAALDMSHSELLASAESIQEGEVPITSSRPSDRLEEREPWTAMPLMTPSGPLAGPLRTGLRSLSAAGDVDEDLLVRRVSDQVRYEILAEIQRWLDQELEPAVRMELRRQRGGPR